MKKVFNVSNRLPVTIGKTIRKSAGGLVTAMEGIQNDYRLQWVGWPGNVIGSSRQNDIRTHLHDDYGYIPVFLSHHQIECYYNGFSNSTLWPLFHYMPNFTRFNEEWYAHYIKVNKAFADIIIENAVQNDLIWIHDYHLMLLPGMLRDRNSNLKIGYFLHTPFPSYEVFRCHPNREALLHGLLGADLIGFHTFGYLRHFRSTLLRILGLESEIDSILSENHRTHFGVYPIGIDAQKFQKELNSRTHRKYLNKYRDIFQNRKVVLSVERLDYTKGIPRKLDAIELFLQRHEHPEDIVFIFVMVPSRGEVEEYQQLLNTVELRISQINGKYSTITNIPLHFMHQSVSFSELCALYALADVCMVTPLVDGMNLVAKEYIACQKNNFGVLILSEFAGAAQELFSAIIVNPYNIDQVSNAIEQAIEMTDDEKEQRNQPMAKRILRYNAKHWAKTFIDDLSDCSSSSESDITRSAALETIKPFIHAQKIALFLDYDGTLCEIRKKPEDAAPNRAIKALFELMVQCHSVDFYLISGRSKPDMQNWFFEYPFTLICEHGFFYRLPSDTKWQFFNSDADLSWKEQVSEIFELYCEMTPGSFIETKTASIVWHYRQADPEFGSWKANQLMVELYEMLSNLPVEIHHGKKIVEVCSTQISKGRAVEYFLQQHAYDRVLCAGDDLTDESMFRLKRPEIISLKIGSGNTLAQYKIPTPQQFREYLQKFISAKINRDKEI